MRINIQKKYYEQKYASKNLRLYYSRTTHMPQPYREQDIGAKTGSSMEGIIIQASFIVEDSRIFGRSSSDGNELLDRGPLRRW